MLARVTEAGPGFFDLALLEQPTTPTPRLERSALLIEFINDEGVARMHGRLDVPQHRRGIGRGYGEKDTVRFAHRGSPQLLKRREYVRATVDLPLTLLAGDADGDDVAMHAHAIDLSGGGMLVKGLRAPRLGDELRFELELGDGEAAVDRLRPRRAPGDRRSHRPAVLRRRPARPHPPDAPGLRDVARAAAEVRLMAKKDKNAEVADGAEGIRLSAHPRARRHIAIAKGWGGLIAFAVVLKLARGAGLPWPDAIERGVLGGIVGYLAAWMIVQTIWRHIALAELEELRRRLIARAETQAPSARDDRIPPARRSPEGRPGGHAPELGQELSRGPHPTDRAAATAAPGHPGGASLRRLDREARPRERPAAAPAPRDPAGSSAAARRRAPAHRRPRLNLSSRPNWTDLKRATQAADHPA